MDHMEGDTHSGTPMECATPCDSERPLRRIPCLKNAAVVNDFVVDGYVGIRYE